MSTVQGADRLEIGGHLPVLRREVGFPNWNRFAAVNFEFMPIHMDDEAGRAAGYPTAIGMGLLHWSYLHLLLREWLARHGRISMISCQFRGATLRNTTITAQAEIVSLGLAEGVERIGLTLWVEDEAGKKLTEGSATLERAVPAG